MHLFKISKPVLIRVIKKNLNKKAFQSNANLPLGDSPCFIVNTFERIGETLLLDLESPVHSLRAQPWILGLWFSIWPIFFAFLQLLSWHKFYFFEFSSLIIFGMFTFTFSFLMCILVYYSYFGHDTILCVKKLLSMFSNVHYYIKDILKNISNLWMSITMIKLPKIFFM